MKCINCENTVYNKSKTHQNKYYCWVCHKYITPITDTELKDFKKLIGETK